jgi:Zn-dependent M28 family amino/carboxypeptidase
LNTRLLDDRLRTHVETLAGEIGERNVGRPDALHAAADYIETVWRSQDYEVVPQHYLAHGVDCANLEVTRPGDRHPEEILLVGAHYDTVAGSAGADDNASGVAALLEIARHFATRRPACTLRFVAFVNEEPPFFYWRQMGSMVYAKAARRRGDGISLMISLEMLGCYDDRRGSQRYPPLFRWFYPDRGNFIAFVSNLRSRRALRRLVAAFRSHSSFPTEHLATLGIVPGVSWSDHLAFWRQGYRALMVTDTAFYRNPWYHTAFDTPERLDYERMARVTEGLAQALGSLASVRQG